MSAVTCADKLEALQEKIPPLTKSETIAKAGEAGIGAETNALILEKPVLVAAVLTISINV